MAKYVMLECNRLRGRLNYNQLQEADDEYKNRWVNNVSSYGIEVNKGDVISLETSAINTEGTIQNTIEILGRENELGYVDNKVGLDMSFYINNSGYAGIPLPLTTQKTFLTYVTENDRLDYYPLARNRGVGEPNLTTYSNVPATDDDMMPRTGFNTYPISVDAGGNGFLQNELYQKASTQFTIKATKVENGELIAYDIEDIGTETATGNISSIVIDTGVDVANPTAATIKVLLPTVYSKNLIRPDGRRYFLPEKGWTGSALVSYPTIPPDGDTSFGISGAGFVTSDIQDNFDVRKRTIEIDVPTGLNSPDNIGTLITDQLQRPKRVDGTATEYANFETYVLNKEDNILEFDKKEDGQPVIINTETNYSMNCNFNPSTTPYSNYYSLTGLKRFYYSNIAFENPEKIQGLQVFRQFKYDNNNTSSYNEINSGSTGTQINDAGDFGNQRMGELGLHSSVMRNFTSANNNIVLTKGQLILTNIYFTEETIAKIANGFRYAENYYGDYGQNIDPTSKNYTSQLGVALDLGYYYDQTSSAFPLSTPARPAPGTYKLLLSINLTGDGGGGEVSVSYTGLDGPVSNQKLGDDLFPIPFTNVDVSRFNIIFDSTDPITFVVSPLSGSGSATVDRTSNYNVSSNPVANQRKRILSGSYITRYSPTEIVKPVDIDKAANTFKCRGTIPPYFADDDTTNDGQQLSSLVVSSRYTDDVDYDELATAISGTPLNPNDFNIAGATKSSLTGNAQFSELIELAKKYDVAAVPIFPPNDGTEGLYQGKPYICLVSHLTTYSGPDINVKYNKFDNTNWRIDEDHLLYGTQIGLDVSFIRNRAMIITNSNRVDLSDTNNSQQAFLNIGAYDINFNFNPVLSRFEINNLNTPMLTGNGQPYENADFKEELNNVSSSPDTQVVNIGQTKSSYNFTQNPRTGTVPKRINDFEMPQNFGTVIDSICGLAITGMRLYDGNGKPSIKTYIEPFSDTEFSNTLLSKMGYTIEQFFPSVGLLQSSFKDTFVFKNEGRDYSYLSSQYVRPLTTGARYSSAEYQASQVSADNGLPLFLMGGVTGNAVRPQVTQASLTANNIPDQLDYPYLCVYSSIVQGGTDTIWHGGIDSKSRIPCVAYITRYNNQGSFFYGTESSFNFTATKDFVITDVETDIRLPDGSRPRLEPHSAVIYKITKPRMN